MPLAFLIAGLLLGMIAIQNTQDKFFALLRGDLLGDKNEQGGFLWFVGGIVIIYLFGLLSGLRDTSKFLISLIVLTFIFANPKVFTQLGKAFNLKPPPPVKVIDVGKAVYSSGSPALNPTPIAEQNIPLTGGTPTQGNLFNPHFTKDVPFDQQ